MTAVSSLLKKNLNVQHYLPRDKIPQQRHLYIAPGSNIAFRVQGPNKEDVNNGINVIFQVSERN